MNNLVFIGRFIDMLLPGGPGEVDIWQCIVCKDIIKSKTHKMPTCHKCSTRGGG